MRNVLLVIGLTLLLAIPLILFFTSLISETFALALWYMVWLGGLVYRSISQVIFWVLFLCVAIVIAGASLYKRQKRRRHVPKAAGDLPGRVALLAHAVRRTEHGDYFKWRLARYLGELTLKALGLHEVTGPGVGLGQLAAEQAEMPEEIRAYFDAGLSRGLFEPVSLFSRLRRLLRLGRLTSPLDLDPERAIQYLEDQLEVSYDR